MISPPKVTIAIPTFNRVGFLKQALDSALSQTFVNLEVVVSDNASTDGTAQMLASYSDRRLVLLRQDVNIGMVPNWNACLSAASGEYFLLLSDDDVLERTAIEEMLSGFQIDNNEMTDQQWSSDENIGAVFCNARVIDGNNNVVGYGKKSPRDEEAFLTILYFFRNERATYPCSILLRTCDIREVGAYDANELTLIADAHAWILCALRRGKIRFLDVYLTNYRVHTMSVTTNSNIDEWSRNNSSLADFCVKYYLSQGDVQKASLIEESARTFNAKAILFLITRHIRGNNLSPLEALAQYFIMYKRYQVASSPRYFLQGAISVLMPNKVRFSLAKVRRLRFAPRF